MSAEQFCKIKARELQHNILARIVGALPSVSQSRGCGGIDIADEVLTMRKVKEIIMKVRAK